MWKCALYNYLYIYIYDHALRKVELRSSFVIIGLVTGYAPNDSVNNAYPPDSFNFRCMKDHENITLTMFTQPFAFYAFPLESVCTVLNEDADC